jgi:hypothetical protein
MLNRIGGGGGCRIIYHGAEPYERTIYEKKDASMLAYLTH